MLAKTFLALGLALPAAAWADRVWVETVKGSGVSEADREAVSESVRITIPNGSRHTLAATQAEAEWTLSPSLMKLGDAYVLSLQKKDKSGRTVFGDKMKASAMSELDTVASRLTRAVMAGSTVSDTADVTNITREEEAMNTRRYQATRQWVFGLGPGFANNVRSKGNGFTFLLGFLWGLDPDFSINLSWITYSGRKNDESGFTDLSLGGEYYFFRGKHTPFAGARIGLGTARVSHDGCNSLSIGCDQDRASGWAATLNGGYRFFRTSSVNAAVILSHSFIFDRTTLGNPSLTSAQIAVYF